MNVFEFFVFLGGEGFRLSALVVIRSATGSGARDALGSVLQVARIAAFVQHQMGLCFAAHRGNSWL